MNRLPVLLLLIFVAACCSTKDCICPDLYDPVCGANNRTYPNPCAAECEGVDYIPGECPVYGIGQVVYSGDSVCGYYISVLGTRYRPSNLPEPYKIHGTTVGMQYRRMNDYFTCEDPYAHHQVIEILEIEKL